MAQSPKEVSDISRRHFLNLGAAAGIALGAAQLLPPSLVEALQRPRQAGKLDDIKHIVILMQENRSFDHYFGTLSGVRGFADRQALPLRTGASIFHQPRLPATLKGQSQNSGVNRNNQQPGTLNSPTVVLPFLVRGASQRQNQNVEYIASLPHGWPDGQLALNHGWCDQWLPAKGEATMACYDRKDIAFQFALAETFTVCDGYFSSTPTSTCPNRNFLFTGNTGFEPGSRRRSVGNDAYEEKTHKGFTWRTYAEELEDAGVSWKVYQEWDNFTDNNLDFFRRFKKIARSALSHVTRTRYLDLTSFYSDCAKLPKTQVATMLKQLDNGIKALSSSDRNLFQRALYRNKEGTLVEAFTKDLDANTLPTVSWIVPSSADSEHPGASSPLQSAGITYGLLDSLAQHEDIWNHTVFLLMFDEFDGYFDHVVPPLPQRGEPHEWVGNKPLGLGFRVPMTVISPWSAGGLVTSEVFDHTSVLRLTEHITKVRSPLISNWRRRICGDLLSTLDFRQHDGLKLPAKPAEPPKFTERWKPQHPVNQSIPRQETGQRVTLPVPYLLDANISLSRAGSAKVELSNNGSQYAVFGVYDFQHNNNPVFRTVRGTDRVTVLHANKPSSIVPSDIAYHVIITGPAGFFRELQGGQKTQAHPVVTLACAHESGLITIILKNRLKNSPLTVHVKSLRANGKPVINHHKLIGDIGTKVVIDTKPSSNWYDITVSSEGDPHFGYTLAGHLENGQRSLSNPF